MSGANFNADDFARKRIDEMTDAPENMPETLLIRDTKLHDDLGGMGQRIYTTAGAGYKKTQYTRTDIAPKVKPLVWELVSRHPHRYESECGGYKVYDSGHDGIAFGYRSDDPCGFTYTYHFDQGSGAFDAAQAHHDTLIRSALVTSTGADT